MSPCCGKGILMPIIDPVKVARRGKEKNEAGQFNIAQPQAQARPCLIVLAARPGNLHETLLLS